MRSPPRADREAGFEAALLHLQILARAGAVGIGTMDDTGEMLFNELRRIRTSRKADKVGTFRWYNHYRPPEHLGGGVITVRLHGNDED